MGIRWHSGDLSVQTLLHEGQPDFAYRYLEAPGVQYSFAHTKTVCVSIFIVRCQTYHLFGF